MAADEVPTGAPDLDAVVSRAEVPWAAVGPEVVVHRPDTRGTFVLDPVGSVLWQCLDSVSPLGDVFADLADGFDVAIDTVVSDCLPVVQSWIEADIAVDRRRTAGASHAAESGRRWRRLVDPPNS